MNRHVLDTVVDPLRSIAELVLSHSHGPVEAFVTNGLAHFHTLLHRLLGTRPIVLTYLPMGSVRSILRRRGQDVDAHLRRFCIDVEKGLFIQGIALPVKPLEILDALAAVGIRPQSTLKKCSNSGR